MDWKGRKPLCYGCSPAGTRPVREGAMDDEHSNGRQYKVEAYIMEAPVGVQWKNDAVVVKVPIGKVSLRS